MDAARRERLGDEWAIRETLARYWRGIDRRDVSLVASAYHEDAYDDHGYYAGPVAGFVDTLESGVWAYFDATMHFSGHIAVDFVRADRRRSSGRTAAPDRPAAALVESYAEAHHFRHGVGGTGEDLVYGLRYVDRFARDGDEWRIAHRVCSWDWHRVDVVGGIPLPDSYARGRALSQGDPVAGHPIGRGLCVDEEGILTKQACLDTLMRYARGVDRCDLELVRSAYHVDAYDDHGGYQGDVDGFLAWLEPTVMNAFDCTMHKLGNCLIEIDPSSGGRRAFAETYAVAHHVQARSEVASDLIMGVRYLDRLEDRGDGFRIAERRMCFEWERSLEIGSQTPYAGFTRGRRDGSDPVVARRDLVAAPATIEVAADRAAIYAVLVRYCRGIDRRDLALVRSCYHDDAYDDHGAYAGSLDGFLDFVACEVHARFRTTMHKLGQALIEIEGDEALAESYAICHHVATERESEGSVGRDVDDFVMGIRYLDRFERREGEWRIARRELRWEWVRTDALEALDPTWTLGRTDAGDPVFTFAADRAGGS